MGRKRNKRSLTKIKIRNSTRVFLVMASLVVFAFASSAFYGSLNINSTIDIEKDVYTYTNKYNHDYKINIKENSFIQEESLPSGKNYVSDLIDSIDMNMKYTYTESDKVLTKYDYKIDAIISASYTSNGKEYNVWNKEYNLKTVDNMQVDGSVTIDEDVNIDYAKYHNEVKAFRQSMGMALDSYLVVRLTVHTDSEVNNKHPEIKNEYVSNFAISIGDKVAIVNDKNDDIKIGYVKEPDSIENTSIEVFKLIFSLICIVGSIYTIYYISFRTKKYNAIRNEFKLELNRILKSCQDRIVIVKNRVNSDEVVDSIVDVNDFGELIKLSEELYKPILCWISDDMNNEEAWLSVISNKVRYRFVLKK